MVSSLTLPIIYSLSAQLIGEVKVKNFNIFSKKKKKKSDFNVNYKN